jgi:hypothetical protein
MKIRIMALLATTLAFTFVALAGPFTVYPGATRMAERGERANPNHAVMYSTPDTYAKVLEYYKKDGKEDKSHPMKGGHGF